MLNKKGGYHFLNYYFKKWKNIWKLIVGEHMREKAILDTISGSVNCINSFLINLAMFIKITKLHILLSSSAATGILTKLPNNICTRWFIEVSFLIAKYLII